MLWTAPVYQRKLEIFAVNNNDQKKGKKKEWKVLYLNKMD